MRVTLVGPSLDSNGAGRSYSLALVARSLGWEIEHVSLAGNGVWKPLRGSAFLGCCREFTNPQGLQHAVSASAPDLVVVVKAMPYSLGAVAPLLHAFPCLLDIDDPDLDVLLARSPRHPALATLRGLADGMCRTYSNPTLRELYGPGTVVPHVREPAAAAASSTEPGLRVAFIGTPRDHKGLDTLRAAVADISGDGVELVVTAPQPADSRPWETWSGETTLDEGQRLLRTSDVCAVPSRAGLWGEYQLPVKVVDAMIVGVTIVASDLPPIRWAVADAGVLVPPGDARALAIALTALRDPKMRCDLARRAHEHALRAFTPDAVASALSDAADQTLRT